MGSKICSQLICILSAHFQLGFSSKLKCPSSARLGSETFQLGLARAGKFQLEPITNSSLVTKFFTVSFEQKIYARDVRQAQCLPMYICVKVITLATRELIFVTNMIDLTYISILFWFCSNLKSMNEAIFKACIREICKVQIFWGQKFLKNPPLFWRW